MYRWNSIEQFLLYVTGLRYVILYLITDQLGWKHHARHIERMVSETKAWGKV